MNMSNFINTPRATSSTFRELLIDKKKNSRLPELVKLSSKTPKLQLTITQNFALPDISRMHTPKPRKISPILIHKAENSLEKHLINLEKLIQREEKLAVMHDSLLNDQSLNTICHDYWELSNDEALWSMERMLKDTRTKKSMVDSIILESLSVSLLIFCSSHVADWGPIANQLRNMIYFIHQNFLTIIDLVLSRLPIETNPSTWVLTLKSVLKAKKLKTAKRSEHSTSLKQNNEIVANCIRTVIRLMPIKTTPALSMIMHILSNRDKFSISVARSYVFQQPNLQEPSITPPYLPEIKGKNLTLVLDLDETLVHYSVQGTGGQLLIRPFCEEFLSQVSQFYELVVFTAGLQEYADWAIDLADPKRLVQHRLYRQHTLQIGAVYIKDLSKLGRDLKKTIIVDNMPSNFQLQQENGLFIRSWVGDQSDKTLLDMAELLNSKFNLGIGTSEEEDIRVAVKLAKSSKKKTEGESLLNLSI